MSGRKMRGKPKVPVQIEPSTSQPSTSGQMKGKAKVPVPNCGDLYWQHWLKQTLHVVAPGTGRHFLYSPVAVLQAFILHDYTAFNMDFIEILPPEISLKVLANLDLKDILNCSLVCKAWYDATNNDCIWKGFWNPNIPPKECGGCADFCWAYGSSCKWKLHRMNHQRIVNNWKEERFKAFEITGSSLDDVSYDGKTLVVSNGPLDIYRIDNGNLSLIQSLDTNYIDCLHSTNTSFITVLYKHVITVFQCNNGKYENSYYLYVKGNDAKLCCTNDLKETDDRSPCDHSYCFSVSDLIFIIGDTLFLFFSYFKVFYAWELKERKCLLQKKAEINNIFGNGNLIYYLQNNLVYVFDKKGENVMKLKARWNIDKIQCNCNIILAHRELYEGEELRLCAWYKKTGKLIFNNKKMIGGGDYILHPTKEVIFILVQKDNVDNERFLAYNLLNGTILWKTPITDFNFFDLYEIVADRFLLMNKNTYHLFDVYDSDSGKYLYSINDVRRDYLYAFYDMLIYNKDRGNKLILHIYS